MSISQLIQKIQEGDLKGKRTSLSCLTLKDFIVLYRSQLEDYYEEYFGYGFTFG